jgi:hypothetical protein
MARRALSKTKTAQLKHEEHTELMAKAVARYQQEQDTPSAVKKMGLRKVCTEVENEHYKKTGKRVSLNHNTLRNLVNGGRLRAAANSEKGWLVDGEADELIRYVIENAEMGHPFSHRRLKEHADEICHARLGTKFPENGVGVQWPHRFVEKHSDKLHIYTAKSLDTARGQAVNEHTNRLWFDVVEEVQLRGDDGKPIAPECTWAMDESGFQANGGEGFERVIGAKGKKVQYQQQAGTRENITVLLTIGASGVVLPPVVLYSGKGYLVKWQQENPAKASYVAPSVRGRLS